MFPRDRFEQRGDVGGVWTGPRPDARAPDSRVGGISDAGTR